MNGIFASYLWFGEEYFEYLESCDFSRENTNMETYRCIRVYVWFKHYQILDKHSIIDIFLSRPHLTSLVHKTNKR